MNNVNFIWILINALNAIFLIIELNILMEILMDNADARMDIMMIIKIVYASNVLLFGNLFINIILFFKNKTII